MRRFQILALTLSVLFLIPISGNIPIQDNMDLYNTRMVVLDSTSLSSAGGTGVSTETLSYMTRELTGLNFGLDNTYLDSSHALDIDLSIYQVPGWTLYSISLNASQITATAERETLGITPTSYIDLINSSGTVTDVLYQAFYNQPHDGKLENYSLTYNCPYYGVTSDHAYLVVRTDFTDPSTNVTSFIEPWSQDLFNDQIATHDTSGDSAILDASTYYFAVIDGEAMSGGGTWWNTIRWRAANVLGIQTGYHIRGDNWYIYQGIPAISWEAELNYTYTPWNKTSNAAIVYSAAEQITMTGNSTPLTGTYWTFTSPTNISQITLDATQSIDVDYDITLRYKKTVNVNPVWYVDISGNLVDWNVTSTLNYPTLTGTIQRYLNVTIPSDWTPTGLYNSTPVNYGHFTKYSTVVHCTDMTSGDWTLTHTAPNYVVDVTLYDSSSDLPIGEKVSILVNADVNITVEDGVGTPMDTGSTNLTIWNGGIVIHAPPDETVSGGFASYLWDISALDNNGTHVVEVFWTNGLEAGYYVVQVFVYYPTTIGADDLTISAYTDNTFLIGIDFDQDYPVRGLDGSLAAVTYSFDSVVNDTLDDDGGGRWTKTVSTASMTSGTYILTVYAEGFALENQSLTISVDLTIETLSLNWSWSNTNDITYTESTNLTVTYQDLSSTRIADAWVNVTFDAQTYNLTWDAISEVYWIELYGSNFTTVPGTANLTVNAWSSGYTSQSTSNVQITISVESTGVGLVVTWDPDRNITYIETITITVSYTFNTIPIDDTWEGVWVRATFSGYPLVNLTYNGISELWEVTLAGSDYLGTTLVTIRASATGYSQVQDIETLLVTEDIPTLTDSWTDSAASTDYATNVNLQITVLDSSGTPINGATLTANVFGTNLPMTFVAAGVYTITIVPQETRGVHIVNVTIAEYGYAITSTFLNLTVRATTNMDVDFTPSEYEQWNLTITVTYTDTIHSAAITNATVTVTIDGVEFNLEYDNDTEVYVREIVLDFTPGIYTMTVVANAQYCNEATESPSLTIQAKSAVYLTLRTEGDPSAEGQVLSVIATLLYNETDTGVSNEEIYFTFTINFANGTTEARNSPTQFDTTNTNGVATWNLEIPAGIIESITITAEYRGSRVIWDTNLTYEATVAPNLIVALLSFFFIEPIGQMIVLSMIVLGVVATAYNKRIKPKKRAARASLENQLQMFRDLETLRHFMAVYLDRGTCVFYHPFTDERIQPDLISGFIAAITSVYGEIKGDGVRGTLEEIQYQGLRLNSYSGEFIIGILILEGEMTPLLKERLQFFIELFENQYDHELTDWNGLIDCFDSEWVVSTLNSAFNYSWLLAHKFGPTQKVPKTDARILDYISAVRDDRNEFYFKDLLSPLAEMLDVSEAAVLDRLLALQDRGIIVPVSIQTILQRQGMGLANGEIGEDTPLLELPKKEELPIDESETPIEETSTESEVKQEPVEEPEPPAEKTESVDDFVKEVESLMSVEPEEEKEELDPMDEFVKDVESLLTKEKDKEENE
ncbi:hypothetical protein EU528_08110 [Candidatus Thorarchaeota archaeon]|nr:MAG: hypothetical protein EU528_08110 [Candidatus Thorarchaeota archaeon]